MKGVGKKKTCKAEMISPAADPPPPSHLTAYTFPLLRVIVIRAPPPTLLLLSAARTADLLSLLGALLEKSLGGLIMRDPPTRHIRERLVKPNQTKPKQSKAKHLQRRERGRGRGRVAVGVAGPALLREERGRSRDRAREA
jgi:hypothetical protein